MLGLATDDESDATPLFEVNVVVSEWARLGLFSFSMPLPFWVDDRLNITFCGGI
jgi:hypothetical protein